MQKKIRSFFLIIIDVILINLSFYIALYLRFENSVPVEYFQNYLDNIFILTSIKIVIFYFIKLYKSLWKYASLREFIQMFEAIIVANILALAYLFVKQVYLPRSIFILVFMLDVFFIGASRFCYRVLKLIKTNEFKIKIKEKKVMIIGAGNAGARIIKELKNDYKLNYKPVVLIDDDEKKLGHRINGIPVLGQRQDIKRIVEKLNITDIIITIPSASKKDIRNMVEECKKTKCKLKILPGFTELIEGKVSINDIRDVDIEDLLGREQVELNINEISGYLRGRKVLVTGGGGSIGSELCRQIVVFEPKELVILDIYENNVYDLHNELIRKYNRKQKTMVKGSSNGLNLKIIIASIRDKQRMEEVMEAVKPDVIFHAAAHKHVPLMEDNPKEAIKNNVFGTLNIVQAADKYGVKRFVMISTDKAVNPTNIMGASKRICEMIIQSIDLISKTKFVAVRFGNVLGSNGSVIPLFNRQIVEGGPVTVTHEDVIRYFMTIPEAVQLVIQAGAIAKGGEIFILNMGEPVRIINLAEDLIRLSGFEPYKDISIEIIGLRPGEKLFEELLLDEEGIESTKHEKIFIGRPIFTDYRLLMKELKKLIDTVKYGSNEDLKSHIEQIVTTYRK